MKLGFFYEGAGNNDEVFLRLNNDSEMFCLNFSFSFKITLNGSSTFLNPALFVWCLCACFRST